jgi:FHA domain-containing protein
MTHLSDVARKLRARVQTFFDAGPDAAATPLELLQAALDQLERHTQPSGRGSRVFPYTRIVVHVAQPDADRPALAAVFDRLTMRLRERLAELRCDMPADVQARVAFDESAPKGRGVMWVECSGDDGSACRPAVDRELPPIVASVVKGQCEQAEYRFQNGGIAIGRGAELTDTAGRVRRNDVVFLDVRDGASETVARAHARLAFDPGSRSYHLFNESGSNPTFVRRAGRSLPVAPRDPRGMRVQSGDEIQLGRAVLKITLPADER